MQMRGGGHGHELITFAGGALGQDLAVKHRLHIEPVSTHGLG